MPSVNVPQAETGEEAGEGGEHLVGNVSRFRASDEQRRPLVTVLVRVLVGEIGQLAQAEGPGEDVQGHAEVQLRLGLGVWGPVSADEVREEELAYGAGLWMAGV